MSVLLNLDTLTDTISDLLKVERAEVLQSSVVTCLRCGGKYNKVPAVNLLQSPTVIEFLKLVNIRQSYAEDHNDRNSAVFGPPGIYKI